MRTARRLDAALAGRVVVRAELRWPTVAGVDLVGRTVLGTATAGKHLLTRFDDGRTLHTHLRMDGAWRTWPTRPGARFGHDVRAFVAAAEWTAVGRRLGMVDVLRTDDEPRLLAHLGPDVLDPHWDRDRAVSALARQGRRGVGESLLDQGVVAGIGTIYLAESLWPHGVSPWAPVDDVEDPGRLLDTARRLMQRAVAAPPGGRPPERMVYGRRGRPCPRCGTPIREGVVGAAPRGRPAFFCPTCQPLPRVP